MFLTFLVAVIAFFFAMAAAINLFFGTGGSGVVLLAGAWALVWWAGRRLKEERLNR